MPAPTSQTVPLQAPFGYQIAWGCGATTITAGGVVSLPQSTDTELGYDTATVRDGRGTTVAYVSYDPHDTATLEYVIITGTGSYDSISASVSYPTQGSMITVTNADASDPINGSNWIVQSSTVRRSNTDAGKVSLKVIRYQGITQ